MIHPHKYIRRLKNNIKTNPKVFLLYSVLRIAVIIVLLRQLWLREYEGAMICGLVLVLFLIPSFMEQQFKIEIPPLFEGIIYVFIFAAEILGEVNNFYVNIPGWDTVLHTINGFLAADVGFCLIDLMNRHSKNVKLSPFYLAMVAFCFSITVGVVWEFIETAGDLFFGQDMQKDYIVTYFNSVTLDPTHTQHSIHVRNITQTVIYTADGTTYTIDGGYLDIGRLDTMKDLFVNVIGAFIFSWIGYFYVKRRGNLQNKKVDRFLSGLMVKNAVDQSTLKYPEEEAPVEKIFPSKSEEETISSVSESNKEEKE